MFNSGGTGARPTLDGLTATASRDACTSHLQGAGLVGRPGCRTSHGDEPRPGGGRRVGTGVVDQSVPSGR